MQTDLKVLMVDDDRELCEEFERCFAETDGIELSASTDSEAEALEYVRKHEPDVVLLDLELHTGEGNGIIFLRKLNEMTDVKRPYVAINTHNSSQVTYSVVRKLGADLVFYKHQKGYCAQYVAEILLTIGEERSGVNSAGEDMRPAVAPVKAGLKATIYAELDKVAINPRCKGYNYLADAIELSLDGPVPNLSSVIGERVGKSKESVERAMQNAINKAWTTADTNDLLKHYKAFISPKRESPTVMEFISYYAVKIKSKD